MSSSNQKILFTILVPCFMFLVSTPAQAAELYFGASQKDIGVGKNFEAGVFVNTDGDSLNVFSGQIVFPKDSLELKEIHEGNSIISLWVERPIERQETRDKRQENQGQVRFAGVVPGGFMGSQGYLFSLIFQPKKTGEVEIGTSGEELLLNDGAGSPAEVRRAPFKLNIVEKSSRPGFLPTDDIDPPETFKPEVSADPNIFDGKWFLVFSTTDKISGIDHYKIKEASQLLSLTKPSWVVGESPYLLRDQTLKSDLYIKAVDKAGNERVVRLPAVKPVTWYENYLIWGILLIGAIIVYLIWRTLRGKKA